MVGARFGLPSCAAVAVFACVSCGGSNLSTGAPLNIAGNYTVALTNGANGCQFMNYTVGSQSSGLMVSIVQTGATATATLSGLAGALFALAIGIPNPTFTGTVSGDSFTLTAIGVRSMTDATCTFTNKVTLAGTITGNAINGTATYSETTNGDASCGYHATCTTVQSFAGARAP